MFPGLDLYDTDHHAQHLRTAGSKGLYDLDHDLSDVWALGTHSVENWHYKVTVTATPTA